jgi:hypothetical protein
VFEVHRGLERQRFEPFEQLPNRRLLWHGSRITNFMGILSRGLHVAPKEAPQTGYMFGKGIYFADVASKAAQYCHATPQRPWGLLLLCEVALGKQHELQEATYMERPPPPCHSTKGCGRVVPDESTARPLGMAPTSLAGAGGVADDGMEIEGEAASEAGSGTSAGPSTAGGSGAPVAVFGPLIDQQAQQAELAEEQQQQYKLQYNEHIVYDIAQVRIRYLVKVHFKFPQ